MAKGKYRQWLTPEGLTLLEGWARDGLTDEQIAKNIGISRETLNQWKNKYADISDALKRGKEVVDTEVENALLKRALGFQYDEVTAEMGVETKRVTKMVVPDTTAQIFWLRNRRPDRWRNADRLDVPTQALTDDPLSKSIEEAVNDGVFEKAAAGADVPKK